MSDELQSIFDMLDDSNDSRVTGESLRPPINYIGNKFEQLDFILPLLPWHETYVEVFGGSGAVLLSKKPSKLEVFNDRFAGSVALYKCLQNEDKMKQLQEKIELMPHAREFFAWCKATWDQETDDVERAARWYYLVQASFSGKLEYFGRVTKNDNSIPAKIKKFLPEFPAIHNRLKKVQIENLDWRHCFKDYDSPSTLFYLDPPYYGCDVYNTGFTKKDHIELCGRIFQLQGAVVLSGMENPIYDQYQWDSVHLNPNVDNRVVTGAFSENNNMDGRQGTVERGVRNEFLWVKESS